MNSGKIALVLAAVALAVSLINAVFFQQLSSKIGSVADEVGQISQSLKAISQRIDSLAGDAAAARSAAVAAEGKASAALNNTSTLLKAVLSPSGEVSVRYARLFAIRYDGPAYILTDALGRKILLLPRGADVQYYRQKYSPDVVVEYPVRRAVFMASTHVAMAYRLYKEGGGPRVLKSIAGIMWGREYSWYLPEVAQMLENGTIKDVGSAYSPNYEALAALKPDIVFVYFYPGPYGTEAVLKRLDQLGIPYAVVNEFQESSPLGRAEWIKFIAAFFNLTDLAVRIFDGVEAKWNALASLAAEAEYKPRVAWFIIYGGVLYPAGSGIRELIRLAGGRYAYANYTKVDLEVVYKHRNDVDVLVWSGYGVKTAADLVKIEPRLKELRPVIAGRVYAYSEAFYQLSNAYPERVPEELIWIIHPELLPPGNFTLFKPLQ